MPCSVDDMVRAEQVELFRLDPEDFAQDISVSAPISTPGRDGSGSAAENRNGPAGGAAPRGSSRTSSLNVRYGPHTTPCASRSAAASSSVRCPNHGSSSAEISWR